jgi:hypothetical protein
MPKKQLFYILIFFYITSNFFGQKKILHTNITTEKIAIDGKLSENSWENAEIATNFFMIFPDNGKEISQDLKTDVKIIYDQEAVYVGAILYDKDPSGIKREITKRDDFATADHFGVFFNGYNDGQQEFRFFVSAAGVQQDGIYTTANGEDFSWDSIWQSKVTITDYGWVVEMKIPYAALRFPKTNKQTWGLNFYREVRKTRQQYTWSLLDNKISNESTQAGILEGIENIETPTRLFFIPYTSSYLFVKKGEKSTGEFKGGLDIKYGINDAFTLDAILIPDFGQTKFDNVELNLSAFEQQFSENRPFFTEGTDLFNKGGLLYSRRIGGAPTYYPELASDEELLNYPNTTNLLNALKVSGRTKNGLGIGILNAVTEKTEATIRKTIANPDGSQTIQDRDVVVEPLSNYNVLVLDQRFNQNSSVSLINTNVTRNGEFRDANVSALVWDLNTKENTFNLNGNFKYSYVNEIPSLDDRKGFDTSLDFGKTKGKYRFNVGAQYVSNEYDNNDLGIIFQNHYHALFSNLSYRILNPNMNFNTFQTYLNLYSEFDNRTGMIQAASFNLNFDTTSKKNHYTGFGASTSPIVTYDFYEPRSSGETKFVKIPEYLNFYYFFSSNYNNKFALDLNPSFNFINERERVSYGFYISPRYRFSDKLLLIYKFNFYRQNNNTGWVAFDDADNTIFARRNRITYTNTIVGKYSINNVMTINLQARYYWSYVVNKRFLTLQDDGSLVDNFSYSTNKNQNLNIWNFDLSYSWWFAPGSQVSLLYRNNSSLFSREFEHSISKNFNEAISPDNLSHVLSLSVRYYIDYNSLKKKKQPSNLN